MGRPSSACRVIVLWVVDMRRGIDPRSTSLVCRKPLPSAAVRDTSYAYLNCQTLAVTRPSRAAVSGSIQIEIIRARLRKVSVCIKTTMFTWW